jgi:uncharacterized membrane protein
MERWISVVLLGGVVLAGAIILLGLGLLVLGPPRPGEPTAIAGLIEQETHPISVGAILAGARAGRPTSLIRLGVLALILTPMARVALTMLLFLDRRDWTFVALTAFVLLILVFGIASGRV